MVYTTSSRCREVLLRRLREPAPGRIQILTGPRQVGKTTLLLSLASALGDRARYAALDGPGADLPGSWERLWAESGERSKSGGAVLLLDEVQHLPDWSRRLKADWDRLRRLKTPVHVVATGSSALRLGTGSRESLAGRFERLTLSHWSARDLVAEFGLSPAKAAMEIVERGGYPGAFSLRSDPARWTAYVRDSIVEPALSRDVLALSEVRRPALLRQVFSVAASSPAQVVSLLKLRGLLADQGAMQTIAHHLQLLQEAHLIAPLEKHARRPARSRAAPPKLVTLSNALLAAVDPRGSPEPEPDPARYGTWVENACLAFAWNAGNRVTYWREEPLEVDGVVEGPWGKWVIEVKTGGFGEADLRGLMEFARRNPSYRPLLLCGEDRLEAADRLGVPAMAWSRFLLDGPAPSA
jgi:predicted AAA+ superfamily ATPase